MSTSCISCVLNEMTGEDKLCDACRDGKTIPEDRYNYYAKEIIKIANNKTFSLEDKVTLIAFMILRVERSAKKAVAV